MSSELTLKGSLNERTQTIFTPAALDFLRQLAEAHASDVPALLAARKEQQAQIDAGNLPDFLRETRSIRESD